MKTTTYFLTALFVIISAAGFSSCKKEKNEDGNKVTEGTASAVLRMDESTINFSSVRDSSVAFLEHIEDADAYNFGLVLKDDNSDALLQMMIAPVNDEPGTHQAAAGFVGEGWALSTVFLDGRSSAKNRTYGAVWVSHDGVVTQSEGSVTISSITENNVKGTFNLVLYSYNPETKVAKKMTVSNGMFDVPLVRRAFEL